MAGYLYKLEVTLRNATVDVTVQCVTQDWIFDKDHELSLHFKYRVINKNIEL